uniref:ethanolamine-phosphate cytidylyltransferase n=1 Tax=Trypanosoma vivax (strain Y486) TaxID=1055687 RepID=G0U8T3_TRYVY|nr:putative ethanolamine-phosphate cytidylyltransferase [Trypanosoma vivax Y486]
MSRVWLNVDCPDDPYPLYSSTPLPPKRPGTTRIWVDGCFDMLHFGHANALRQARSLGDELFVGCHTDGEITRYKGPPIMREEERYEALRACKWVDFVVEGYPYVTRLEDMRRFEVDYVVHGDDITVDLGGRNSYQTIIDAGMFKVVKRTECISTTDLVGRMLLCTPPGSFNEVNAELLKAKSTCQSTSHYLTTSRKIAQFSNKRPPHPGARVVYVDGSFDLFHPGHIRFLQRARELGDYLIVGVHEDSLIRKAKGDNFPLMSLNERVLGLLSCRYVDEVILGAPRGVTREMMDSLKISLVACGKASGSSNCSDSLDPYEVPKSLGCYTVVDSGSTLTSCAIINRVVENLVAFLERQEKKHLKDSEPTLEIYKNVAEV